MNAHATASHRLPEPMLRSEAYPHPTDDLQLHETHISWVILAGAHAYKVKKPVALGFLDFSDVERRATACDDEVRLNRRLCPDVYLGVVWLADRGGELFVGGDGHPVEPIVQMRRLPAEGSRLHLFDCIEFNVRFRCADVAAEVAFLAMDLDHYARPDLASAFVEAYVGDSGDAELRVLLDFYRCYRAYVRGKVASLRLAEPNLTMSERQALADEARTYFVLAHSYIQRGG